MFVATKPTQANKSLLPRSLMARDNRFLCFAALKLVEKQATKKKLAY